MLDLLPLLDKNVLRVFALLETCARGHGVFWKEVPDHLQVPDGKVAGWHMLGFCNNPQEVCLRRCGNYTWKLAPSIMEISDPERFRFVRMVSPGDVVIGSPVYLPPSAPR